MGRLVPVFEERDGRMLWEGKLKDQESERVGYLTVGHIGSLPSVGSLAEVKFTVDAERVPRDPTNLEH